MTKVPAQKEPQGLHELAWIYAQDGRIVFDAGTGTIVDANPASEALTGYSHRELAGMSHVRLYPEGERKRVQETFQRLLEEPSSHSGYHILRKDGRVVPVSIWSSAALRQDGRTLVILGYHDRTELEAYEHRLATKRWALSAYAQASHALWVNHTAESLLTAICEGITREHAYALAWVGIAEDGPGRPVRVAAACGSALS